MVAFLPISDSLQVPQVHGHAVSLTSKCCLIKGSCLKPECGVCVTRFLISNWESGRNVYIYAFGINQKSFWWFGYLIGCLNAENKLLLLWNGLEDFLRYLVDSHMKGIHCQRAALLLFHCYNL